MDTVPPEGGWFFFISDQQREGVGWLEQLLAAAPDAPIAARTKALTRAAELVSMLADVPRARSFAEQALTLARPLDNRRALRGRSLRWGFTANPNILTSQRRCWTRALLYSVRSRVLGWGTFYNDAPRLLFINGIIHMPICCSTRL